jgi:hypothetical protein
MSAELPDTRGYPLAKAPQMLVEAGSDAVEVSRVGPSEERSPGRRTMVIRQRSDGERVSLTVSAEWRTPMRQSD